MCLYLYEPDRHSVLSSRVPLHFSVKQPPLPLPRLCLAESIGIDVLSEAVEQRGNESRTIKLTSGWMV